MLDGGKCFTTLVDGVGIDGGIERGAWCCAAAGHRGKRGLHAGVGGRDGHRAVAGCCAEQCVGIDDAVGEDQAVKGGGGATGDFDRLIEAGSREGQGVVDAVSQQGVVGEAAGEVDFVVRACCVTQVIGQSGANEEGIFGGGSVVLNGLTRSCD